MRSTKWLWGMVGLIAVGTLTALVGFGFRYASIGSFLWPLPLVLLAPGLTSISGLTLAMKDMRHPRLAMLTAIDCVLVSCCFLLGMFDIDISTDPSGTLAHVKNLFLPATIAFGFWGGFFVVVRAIKAFDRPIRIAKLWTLISGTALTLAWLAYAVLEELFSFDEAGWRIGLTLATIVVTGGLLSLPFLYQLQQKRRSLAEQAHMAISGLLCPRCGANCATDAKGACVQCQLPIELDLREPRCACGYLLVNLDGNTCPECGRRFAARIRYEMVSDFV